MSALGKLAAGDRLLMVTTSARNREPVEAPRFDWMTVRKVGRKYAEVQPEGETREGWGVQRFELERGAGDSYGGTREVRFYWNEAAFHEAAAARATFRKFNEAMRFRWDCPPGVTEADIRHAAELLKLDLKA